MSKSDDYFRRHRQRPPEEEPEEAPKSAPLVSQGARSGGFPRRQVTPDDLIRRAARRGSAPGGWERI
jgi:hypothetical protein